MNAMWCWRRQATNVAGNMTTRRISSLMSQPTSNNSTSGLCHMRRHCVAAPPSKWSQLPLVRSLITATAPRSSPSAATNTETKKPKRKDSVGASAEKEDETVGYWASKQAAKDRRRELYEARQERKERLVVRRAGRPQDERKKAFQQFFIRKRVQDEVWDRRARQAGKEWKIRVAVLVERLAVVLADKQAWEVDYENMKARMTLYGKMYPKELVGEQNLDELDASTTTRPMTDDDLLALLPFEPAPRETAADASGDVQTLQRRLKNRVYLAVQQDSRDVLQLPTVDVQENETLLEAAKRAVPELVGDDLEFWSPSNAPWTVDLQPFAVDATESSASTDQYYGSKTFVIKVQYTLGEVTKSDAKVPDFAWLDRSEIVERVKQQQGEYMSQYYYYML